MSYFRTELLLYIYLVNTFSTLRYSRVGLGENYFWCELRKKLIYQLTSPCVSCLWKSQIFFAEIMFSYRLKIYYVIFKFIVYFRAECNIWVYLLRHVLCTSILYHLLVKWCYFEKVLLYIQYWLTVFHMLDI